MLSTLFVINILLALVIIFLERRDPASTLAWIMVLFGICTEYCQTEDFQAV